MHTGIYVLKAFMEICFCHSFFHGMFSLQELYTQCRHYSASVRLDAVNGLKELISSNPELVSPNLSDILERAAELLIDKDTPVRQAAVRFFKLFLPGVTDKQISPFFPLLCAHLCCAMTHIYDEIQEDSLSVLDLLLETFPKLMITKSSQVLPNFIEQISRRQGQGKAKRSLTTNPNSSTSSVKWRISVLNRLYKFLNAILKYGMFESSNAASNSVISSQASNTEEVIYSSDCQLLVQPCPRRNRVAWTNPGFILGYIIKVKFSVINIMYIFISISVPVLLIVFFFIHLMMVQLQLIPLYCRVSVYYMAFLTY